MSHPLVTQLRFARSEFMRCLKGVTDEEARKRFLPMNCISWMAAHLAEQESRYWLYAAQGISLHPELRELAGYGRPASTPPLEEVLTAWGEVAAAVDPFLDTFTPALLITHFERNGKVLPESAGTMLQRNIYHYWFHTGEAYAVRQMLGHTRLPDFVGDMSAAIYIPETGPQEA
jgi:hypothetical protein